MLAVKPNVIVFHDFYMQFIFLCRTPVPIKNSSLERFSKELVRVSGGQSLPFQQSGEFKYD